jgi:hypothetical protein
MDPFKLGPPEVDRLSPPEVEYVLLRSEICGYSYYCGCTRLPLLLKW